MVHKAINNMARSYLSELFHKTKKVHNHDTRGSTHGLFPKHSNLKFGLRSLASYGCKVWNSLDRDVQATEEPKRFKKTLRERLLKKPRNECIFQKNLRHKLRRPLGRANALNVFERVPSLNKFNLI